MQYVFDKSPRPGQTRAQLSNLHVGYIHGYIPGWNDELCRYAIRFPSNPQESK